MVAIPWYIVLVGGLVILGLPAVLVVYLVTRAGDGEG